MWIAIRRGLRPIDRMVGTAEAIAEGHTDERIDVTHPDSEVGRLNRAFNLMLDRIGESLAAHGVGAEDAPVRGRRLHELRPH